MKLTNSNKIMQLTFDYGYIKKKEALKIINIFKYGRVTCELCKKPLSKISIDHIIPKSKGGGEELKNLRLTHSHCNSLRGNKFTIKDLIRLLF